MAKLNATAPQSSSATIRRVTGITAIHQAGKIDVCCAGTKVALHIYTTDGEVLVHMRLGDFLRSCRGPKDAHGIPFRTLEQIEAERLKALASEPPSNGVSAPTVNEDRRGKRIDPERERLYREILAIQNAPHEYGAIAAACKARGISQPCFCSWRDTQRRNAE